MRKISTDEQIELDRLKALYPDLPIDDDPMKESILAWRRVVDEGKKQHAKFLLERQRK